MEREHDIIELGAATAETKGPGGPVEDGDQGIFLPGLSDD
jgi:hypothetical protein